VELGFKIPESGSLDLLSLGALVHRLDPGIIPFRKASNFAVHVSGGEFNVAANLADAFGLNTGIATAMVSYPVGDLIAERVRGMGVKPFYKRFAHDGVHGPNMATVYSDQGLGVRAPVVFYNRANEAAAMLKPGDFDWKAIFASGVRWFHSGGIFSSLSETTSALVIEAMQAARAAGVITSLDLNYREKLWKPQGGMARAHEVLSAVVENVDVLIGNEEDLQKGLGFAGPEVSASAKTASSKLDTGAFLSMMEHVARRFPQTKIVATTLREVHTTNRHSWSAPTTELQVLDRVGGGDGFASGFIYGLLSGAAPEDAIKLGWAHGALMTTFPGDTTMATLEQVVGFAAGGSARIQR
jgi:2-dehydro-3-deoxygluconokinase